MRDRPAAANLLTRTQDKLTHREATYIYIYIYQWSNENYVSSAQALEENKRLSHGEPLISVYFRRQYIIICLKAATFEVNCEWITEVSPH